MRYIINNSLKIHEYYALSRSANTICQKICDRTEIDAMQTTKYVVRIHFSSTIDSKCNERAHSISTVTQVRTSMRQFNSNTK